MTTPNLPENDTSNNQQRVAHIVVDQHGDEIGRPQHSLGDTRLFRILGGGARRWASGVGVTPRQEPAPIDPQILGVRVSEWQEKGLSALSNEAFERLAIERPDALRAQMYKETFSKEAMKEYRMMAGALGMGVVFIVGGLLAIVAAIALFLAAMFFIGLGAQHVFNFIVGVFGYELALLLCGVTVGVIAAKDIMKAIHNANRK